MAILSILLRSVAEDPERETIVWGKGEKCDSKTSRYVFMVYRT